MTHVNFWGVRGSTPCDGHQFDRYGGNTSCVEVASEGHDPIVFDLGTGSAQLRRPARGRRTHRRLPRHRAAHPPALGPHPGPAVLRAARRRRRHGHRDRTAPGGRPARHRVPPGDEPAVLPDHPRGAAGRRRVRGGRQRRLRAQRRQGAVALGAPHRPHARLPGRDGGRVGRVPLRPRARHRRRRRRRLRAARRARPLRRRRPPHPRRAAHRRGVRDQAHVGSLHGRVRDPRREGSRRAPARAVPPLPVARRREPRHHPARRARVLGEDQRPRGVRGGRRSMRHELRPAR